MNTEYVEYIEHDATVIAVKAEESAVTVRIDDEGDCGACPAARLCSLADKEGKAKEEYTVNLPNAADFAVGERVMLRGTEQMHRRAIMLATVIPCICLLIIMIGVYLLTGNQTTAAIAGLTSMVIFFLTLYLLRNRVAHEFNFTIHKPDSNH